MTRPATEDKLRQVTIQKLLDLLESYDAPTRLQQEHHHKAVIALVNLSKAEFSDRTGLPYHPTIE